LPISIKFPSLVTSAAEKTAFLYRLQERLRLEHNKVGGWSRTKRVSRKEWDEFLRGWNEKNDKVVNEILSAREKLKADDSWQIDLEAAFEPQEE